MSSAQEQAVNIKSQPFDSLANSFLEEFHIVWDYGLFGISIGEIIVALAIFFGFLVLRGVFSKYVLHHLHKWAERTESKADDKVIDALIPPIKFIPVIMGFFFAGQYMDMADKADTLYQHFIRSLIAFTIFWALFRAIEPVSHLFHKLEELLSKSMVTWIFKVIRFLIVFIGGSVILEIWGIQVAPLLAGLGLFGAAVALGAQDLFKNLIGGLTVLAEKRFHPGEWILVDGVVEGTVAEIGFRSTKVIRFDRSPVYVPNSKLSDAAVTNFTRMSHRRIYWNISVVYSTTTEQLKEIRDGIMGYIQDCDDFAKEKGLSTFVRIDSFNDFSIDIMVYCFTKSTVWGEWLEAKEKFAFEIKRMIEEAGSSFALPSQSLYMQSDLNNKDDEGRGKVELFTPPPVSDSIKQVQKKKKDGA